MTWSPICSGEAQDPAARGYLWGNTKMYALCGQRGMSWMIVYLWLRTGIPKMHSPWKTEGGEGGRCVINAALFQQPTIQCTHLFKNLWEHTPACKPLSPAGEKLKGSHSRVDASFVH